LLSDAQRRLLYTDSSLADRGIEATYDLLREAISEFDGESTLDQWRFLQQRSFTAEGVYQWNSTWSRNYGLEMRHPYLDDDLNAYMARLTFSRSGKENQRNFAATILPEEFVKAPKIFQTIPIGTWFKGPLRDFLRSTLESRELSGLIDKAVVTHLVEMHMSGRADHAFTLWGLASFVLWSKQVLHAPGNRDSSFVDISKRTVEQQRQRP
jgi:asparagine synthase (glutamine-hydrolysing)